MRAICYECGAELRIENERIEWDGELRVEVAHCSRCGVKEFELEKEYERGFENGREEAQDESFEEIQDETNDRWNKKIEKFEEWIIIKFLTEDPELYREIRTKLSDLEIT